MVESRGSVLIDFISGGGIGKASSDIGNRPKLLEFRLMPLSCIGIDFNKVYYGDTLTVDTITNLFSFGINTVVKYHQLNAGWQYNYDAYSHIFHVIDAFGNETQSYANTLSDLGIVWDILESHQFMIYFSMDREPGQSNEALKHTKFTYNAAYKDDAHKAALYKLIREMDDGFVQRNYHLANAIRDSAKCHNLLSADFKINSTADMLLSEAPLRENELSYDGFAVKPDADSKVDVKRYKKRNAVVNILIAEILMSVVYITISNRNNPVYEPWLLWKMWIWIGRAVPLNYRDKIFDLSPNWGG